MAFDKLHQGIRGFAADAEILKQILVSKVRFLVFKSIWTDSDLFSPLSIASVDRSISALISVTDL